MAAVIGISGWSQGRMALASAAGLSPEELAWRSLDVLAVASGFAPEAAEPLPPAAAPASAAAATIPAPVARAASEPAAAVANGSAPAPVRAAAPVAVAPPAVAVAAPPARPVPLVAPGSDLIVGDFFVHLPPTFGERMEVLVALHGMGGRGSDFCQALLARADRERWIVVAPTFAYGNWQDPNEVMREESSRFIPRLHEFIEDMPRWTGLQIEPKVAFFGFSRGAQLAARYAMVYPEQTLGVVAISAGTYMLPYAQVPVNGQNVTLRYPFGTSDLQERFGRPFDMTAFQKVPFWIAVGANDRNPGDVPRQWDPYLGNNRVARAEAFYQWLDASGLPVRLNVFPGVEHAITEPISTAALDFFASLDQ